MIASFARASRWAIDHSINRRKPPTLGRGVNIAALHKISGNVRIGDYASIAANAVVLTDVPAYAAAVGIPAQHHSQFFARKVLYDFHRRRDHWKERRTATLGLPGIDSQMQQHVGD